MAPRESFIEISNHTPKQATMTVQNVDNYDWDGVSRPDRNLNGVALGPGQTVNQREVLNTNATSHMFTLTVKFNDGTYLILRIDQGVARGHQNGDALKLAEEGANIAAEGGEVGLVIGAALAITGLTMYAFQHAERGKLSVLGHTSQYRVAFRSDGETLYVGIHQQ